MIRPEESAITQDVVDRFAGTPDPRLKQIVTALTRSLHGFVQEVEPTSEEWLQAIKFLTGVGQMCSDSRQEFILLSDTLGVSMLVDAINHRLAQGATEPTVLGPFFVAGAPTAANGVDISGGAPGEPLYVEATICSIDGQPIPNAQVDVWQSDSEGMYDVQRPDLEEHFLRARLTTDAEGKARFWSILPIPYPIPNDGPVGKMLDATGRHPWRPAHLHFMIEAAGYRTLVTHLFVRGSEYLDSDAVFGVKDSLICDYPQHSPGVAPDGKRLDQPWRSLTHTFVLDRA